VNSALEKFVRLGMSPGAKGWESKFDSLMVDYIRNSGKRIRPILGIMVYRGMGGRDLGDGIFEFNIEDKDLDMHMEAARGCPALCVHIVDKRDGKKLI